MLQGQERNAFFDNIDNKKDLLKLVYQFMKCEEARASVSIQIVINDEEDTWQFTKNTVQMLFRCNQRRTAYRRGKYSNHLSKCLTKLFKVYMARIGH